MSKVLFDNNVPVGVARFLRQHQILTAFEMGWAELQNGCLLAAAEAEGFNVFLTADQGIPAEQNMVGRSVAIVVLGSNAWPLLRARGVEIGELIQNTKPGDCSFLEVEEKRKRRRPR